VRLRISCQCSPLLNDKVLRTRLAHLCRKVVLKRSMCAVSPVSFPTARCRLGGQYARIRLVEMAVADRPFAIGG
jgi:hypothetical protein